MNNRILAFRQPEHFPVFLADVFSRSALGCGTLGALAQLNFNGVKAGVCVGSFSHPPRYTDRLRARRLPLSSSIKPASPVLVAVPAIVAALARTILAFLLIAPP